jgi:hypothetical protein
MIYLSQCQDVFDGKGFLSNDPGHGSPYRHISHIVKCNPVKLLKRLTEFGYYYDKCRFDFLLAAKVNPLEDKDVVLNEFTGKIITSVEELYNWIENDCLWHYVEYTK